jgi:tetratricopeptide (TPR) repeat protein
MRFGRYELLMPLGAGGMGEVFRARDRDLERDVAVKFLAPRFASDAERLARFAFEARTASSLNHPNIVTIHEIGQAEGLPFIVMELVEGQTLRKAMRDGRLPIRRVLDIGAQIADGLAKAHAAGIVHRDLKPENVMLTPDGFVKILDFGLAKLHADAAAGTFPSDGGRSESPTTFRTGTRDGAIIGTVGYMSPEQAAGRPADYRADQFALGATLYEMATGRQAFQRDSVVQTLNAIIEHDPPPLAELNPSFPAPARWIAERCLSKAPGDRYASTLDLARELRGVREHLSEASNSSAEPRPVPVPVSTPVPAPVPAPVPPPRRLRVGHFIGAAAVVLAALMAIPAIRESVLERLHLLPIPAEKRIAVLPVSCPGATAAQQAACDGLLESVATRLGALQKVRQNVSFVPAIDVRQLGVATAADARRRLGATLAVSVGVLRSGPRTSVEASLIDAVSLRELRTASRQFDPMEASLFDETVDAVTGMLEIELGQEDRRALLAGATRVPAASGLYVQALGVTPYQQGQSALERADQQQSLEKAIGLFNKALELDPRYALAHVGLARAHLGLFRLLKRPHDAELAEDHCRRAIDIDDLSPHPWMTLGDLHEERGKRDQALDELQRALARDPRNGAILSRIGRVYHAQERFQEAEEMFRKAVSVEPGSWSNQAYYGWFLTTQRRWPDAEVAMRCALDIAPENPRVLSNISAVYGRLGRPADARAALERSISIYPTSGALSNLATMEYSEGRFAEAARIYSKATEVNPRDYRVWRNLAIARTRGGIDAAGEAWRRALELGELERGLNPNSAPLAVQVADCHAKVGEATEARRLLAEAERLAPEDRDVAKTAAEVYEDMGDRDAALGLLGVAFARGLAREEVERAPTFEKLRADPRYQALVARLASGRK